jgi:hypothetical protein
MTLVKTDRPRRIDRVIDYFGELRSGASSDPRPHESAMLPYRGAEDLDRAV